MPQQTFSLFEGNRRMKLFSSLNRYFQRLPINIKMPCTRQQSCWSLTNLCSNLVATFCKCKISECRILSLTCTLSNNKMIEISELYLNQVLCNCDWNYLKRLYWKEYLDVCLKKQVKYYLGLSMKRLVHKKNTYNLFKVIWLEVGSIKI